ncbi:MAG: ABC transporter substrate-binding protein [Oxalobacteraceae bacterium]|jgi:branched-chain amino acid transport system substrate-binding protein|nr:ABC transporter substrate-binding protein [Oxalobacteraceae bacterium]
MPNSFDEETELDACQRTIANSNRAKKLCITSALSLCVFLSTAVHAQTIRIGLSGPFTGGSSPMGESMRNGVRLAADEINSSGGINGLPIELIERDDTANNEIGAKIADELTRAKVVATIGIVNTGVGLASIDYYQKAKIPLVVAVSTGPALTRKFSPPSQPVNFIFRVSPTLDLEAKVLAADLKRKGLMRVALMADTTPYGDSGVSSFAEQARIAGLDVVIECRFKVGDTDMSSLIKRARSAGATALVVWGIGPELASIARGVQSSGWRVPLLGSWTLSMRNFIDAAGPAGDGALMPQTFIQDAGSTTKNSFLLAYHRAYKTDLIPSPMSAAQGYDGMHLLAHAIRQSKSLEGDAIRNALENLNFRYQGVVTSYEKPFSSRDHDAITTNMIVMGKVLNGRVDYAYAEDQQRSAILRVKRHSN